MEPEGSLPYSQASATCPYPGPTQSSPHTHIPPIKCLQSKIYKPGLEYHTATYRYDPRLHNQQYIVFNGVPNLHISSLPKSADFIFYLLIFWRRQSSIWRDEI